MRTVLLLLLSLSGLLLSAQVQDDFSDGDFSTNPTWDGDVSLWQVSADFRLQTDGNAASETIYLSTPSTRVADTEWRIALTYLNAPSASNRPRIYLTSDQSDLTGPLNGYFLEAGESGSNDSYDLYIQTGTSETLLIDGIDGEAGSQIDATVRVLRDASGNWELYLDNGNTGTFSLQGSATDATHTNSSFMGVVVSHTSSRADDFFFDNVYVGDEIVDTDPPQFVSLTPISATSAQLVFDEPLDASSAELLTNYTLSPTLGTPTSAQLNAGNSAAVDLTWGSPFINNTTYTLTFSNLTDLNGNALPAPQNESFTYLVPDEAAFRDIILNEFLPDPSPAIGLPEVEFVEVFNRSSKILDLSGWTISDASSSGTVAAGILLPNEYAVLAAASDTGLFASFGGKALALSSLPSLNNTGDQLTLASSDGTIIDSLTYDDSWYRSADSTGNGRSLELINPFNESCPVPANWRVSQAPVGGTPGNENSVFSTQPESDPPFVVAVLAEDFFTVEVTYNEAMDPASIAVPGAYALDNGVGNPASVQVSPNAFSVSLTFSLGLTPGEIYTLTIDGVSDCSGNPLDGPASIPLALGATPQPFDLVITEIFPDPEPVVGLPTAEFLEIFNRRESVISLGTLSFTDGSSTTLLPNAVIFPGEYLILCAEDNAVAFAPFGRVLPLSFLPSLNNAADSLRLAVEGGDVIDYVFYDDDWYGSASRSDGGFTLERVDVDFIDCNRPGNWRASEDVLGGTPGEINSIAGTFTDTDIPAIQDVIVQDEQTLRVLFSEPMDPASLLDVQAYSLTPGLGTPISAQIISTGNQSVILTLSQQILPNTLYQLNVSGLLDCAGNELSGEINFGIPLSPQPFDIVINEFFPDFSPRVGLPEAEFIELYNRTDNLLDLRDFLLKDNGSLDQGNLGNALIFPREHLIICSEDDAPLYADRGRVLGLSVLPAINNSTDSLYLFDRDGNLIDYVFFNDDWYGDTEKRDGGYTLERIDPDFVDCNQADNWRASNDPSGGTPGGENSVRGTFIDDILPEIAQVRPIQNGIEIWFSEAMAPERLEEVDRYQVDQGVGAPLLATAVSPHNQAVRLIFASPLDTNRVYVLNITELQDCAGNLFTTERSFGLPVPAQAGDVLLNEILFNPYTGGADFVEIVNVSDNILDFSELEIGEIFPETDSIFNADPLAEASTIFLPGEIICLTADIFIQQLTYRTPGYARFLETGGFPSYDDASGECVIYTNRGIVLDRFAYLDDYHYPTLSDDEGVSLERISLNIPTQNIDNWHSASSIVGYATPGYENSQAQELSSEGSEVFLDKKVFTPNLDGEDDVVGIQYQFDFPGANVRVIVYDIQGHLIRTLQQNILLDPAPGVFFWDGFDDNQKRAPLGTYIINFEVVNDDTGERKQYREVVVLGDKL